MPWPMPAAICVARVYSIFVARFDAVFLGGEGMPKFVQQHAAEERQNEADAGQRRGERFPRPQIAQADSDNDEQKRGMNVNADAGEGADFPGPFHDFAFSTMFSQIIYLTKI
jgi:hypothetical protein